jgi:hypothetical protein
MTTATLSPDGEYRLRNVYYGMKDRCYNPKSASYKYYGQRGIGICDMWLQSYAEFREWAISNGYQEDVPRGACTIDRIDVNGNYEPDNCRWVDMKVQVNNRRSIKSVDIDIKTTGNERYDATLLAINAHVRAYVAENGITMGNFAEKIGIGRTTFYTKLNGESKWYWDEVIEIASLTGCSLDELAGKS